MKLYLFYSLFIIVSFVGMLANFTNLWLDKNITGSLKQYLFKDYPQRTLASVIAILMYGFGIITSGKLDAFDYTMLMGAFTAGYFVDNLVNKGK